MLRFSLLPKSKVEGSAFVPLTVKAAGAFLGVFQIASGKDSVMEVAVVFLHVEINAAVALVGVTCIEYLLHGLDLLEYVAGRTRLD